MSKSEIIVAGIEIAVSNLAKILLVGMLLAVIGLAVYAFLNPELIYKSVQSMMPLLVSCLVILALCIKAVSKTK